MHEKVLKKISSIGTLPNEALPRKSYGFLLGCEFGELVKLMVEHGDGVITTRWLCTEYRTWDEELIDCPEEE